MAFTVEGAYRQVSLAGPVRENDWGGNSEYELILEQM